MRGLGGPIVTMKLLRGTVKYWIGFIVTKSGRANKLLQSNFESSFGVIIFFVVVEMVEVELLLFVFVVAIFAKGDNAQGFLTVIYSSKLNHAIVLWF